METDKRVPEAVRKALAQFEAQKAEEKIRNIDDVLGSPGSEDVSPETVARYLKERNSYERVILGVSYSEIKTSENEPDIE